MSDPMADVRNDIEALETHLAHDIEALEQEHGVRVTSITVHRRVMLTGSEVVSTHADVSIDRRKPPSFVLKVQP